VDHIKFLEKVSDPKGNGERKISLIKNALAGKLSTPK
jgi:hypothetical protein